MTWESPLRNTRTAAFVVAFLALLVYANSLGNGFVYDDAHIIVENEGIHQLETLPEALTEPYWPGRYGRELGLWRPVTTLVLGLEYAVAGENPFLYHVVNVVGHAAVSALVVLLLASLLTVPAAFAGGVIFAVHPVHVEAVANVIGMAEVLSTLPFLLACLLHLRGPERSGWGRSLAIGGLYLVAFGFKESAVTLPGAIFLLDAARRRLGLSELAGYLRDRWRVYLAMIAVAGLMLGMRFQVLGSIASPFGPLGAGLLEEVPRIWTLAEVWSHYVRLMVFPMDLSGDYSPNVIPISLGWNAANLVGLGLALAILAGALLAWREGRLGPGSTSARAASFGVIWFMITISPVSNVFFLAGVLLAERTLYLPSVGIALALGWLVVRLSRDRPRGAWVALTVAALLMAGRTWDRNTVWQDNDAFFLNLIEEYPQSGRAQWLFGDLFFRRGDESQAMVSYRAAIDLVGPNPQMMSEISRRLMGAEKYGPAQALMEYSFRYDPDLPTAPGLIAVIRSELGDVEGTERWARIALAIDDDDSVRYHLLAWALTEQGRWEEAAEARRRAIERGEAHSWQQWVSLAQLQARVGDTGEVRLALDSARAVAESPLASLQVDSLLLQLLGDSSAFLDDPRSDSLVAAPSDAVPGGGR